MIVNERDSEFKCACAFKYRESLYMRKSEKVFMRESVSLCECVCDI